MSTVIGICRLNQQCDPNASISIHVSPQPGALLERRDLPPRSAPATRPPRVFNAAPNHAPPVLVLLALLGFALANSPCQAEPRTKTAVGWQDASLDRALKQATPLLTGGAGIVTDSYDDEKSRSTFSGSVDDADGLVKVLAKEYRRGRLRRGSISLLRHPRWFDLEAATRPIPGTAGVVRTCEINRTGGTPAGGEAAPLRVVAGRARLREFCSALTKAVGKPYSVDARLARRQLNAIIPCGTAAEVREAITALFADSEWVRLPLGWQLRLRPESEAIRQALERWPFRSGDDDEMLTKEALAAQAVGELTSTQHQAMAAGAEVGLPWSTISSSTRALVLQWGGANRNIAVRSGNLDADLYPDLSRVGDLAVMLRFDGQGRLHSSVVGRTRTGMRVVF